SCPPSWRTLERLSPHASNRKQAAGMDHRICHPPDADACRCALHASCHSSVERAGAPAARPVGTKVPTRATSMESGGAAGYKRPKMGDWYVLDIDPAHAAREREKARALRKSAWWQRRLQRGLCAYCEKPFKPA